MTFLSSDALRAFLVKTKTIKVLVLRYFVIWRTKWIDFFRKAKMFVSMLTNMHRKARKPWVDFTKETWQCITAYVFIVDRETLIDRNQSVGQREAETFPLM
jgi:hypothetical protein